MAPYPGIEEGKMTAEVESCVSSTLAELKKKNPNADPKKLKSKAIAICHVSVMKKHGKWRGGDASKLIEQMKESATKEE